MNEAHDEGMEKYYTALGELVHNLAYIEGRILFLLWNETAVTPEVGRAIFSGTRMDAALSFINRTYQAKGQKLPDILNDCFTQLKVINSARNDILHYGTQFLTDDIEPFVSKSRVAISDNVTVTKIDTQAVLNMVHDLHTVTAKLNQYALKNTKSAEAKSVEVWEEVAARTWLYKPVQRPIQDHLSLRKSAKSPRKSSQE